MMHIWKTILAIVSSFVILTWGSAEEKTECTEMTLSSGLSLYCPTEKEPNKTDCCYSGGMPSCCINEVQDQTLVMTIALSVIILCFVLTILIVVCCFCPNCLLYDACRAKYSRTEIIAYTKEEEMALNSTMPYEDQHEKSSYSTQAIKIKPIADV
ncbi:Acyl-lipid (8-3)-desaturase [Frankliniella fusca]|uniref:Acyl-lipid (8-3)-desaturase n=1 Tax=Frankliniella fusca TaxID=407009 RepID=A0AAE1HSA8_9NEOP|nr:Acyl-lipid (8-3)-desaturase [Frankliniella fusca]